jgi:tRNA nucleotidyltransferase (CCA-adding enzyme)
MAYNDAGLVDPFGGREDLQNGLIRCVGSAEERFSEDYLRMLRAYRFAAVLRFRIDENIQDYVKKHAALIQNEERIRTEFDKTVLWGNREGVLVFNEFFLDIIFPEIVNSDKTRQVLAEIDETASLTARFAVLFRETDVKRAASALKRAKYDNSTVAGVLGVLNNFNAPLNDKPSVKRVLCAIGENGLRLIQRAVTAF